MIEPKLIFFKMQIKSGFGKSPELGQSHFSDPPEVFDSVDMGLAVGKFISATVNPMVFLITPIHQAIITSVSIEVDRAFNVHLAPDHRL